MEELAAVIALCVNILKMPFTIWGFTLNLWDILIWSLIAGIILWLIVRFFYD
ncbi:hypothetical protein NE626_12030 [Intestinimonas massiliensis]|jgi:hypothetical protein|uniref:hypothetical protein n=1 Tax=Intestinimonas massiliensis (ex Afouda et al. 2020) TaxID=1673721 RepID=UPI00210966F9|nr:hypothetical protein [Intestinimonas massiliensis (ex Afouda et al. 2020)]MCQ4807542.1 hypothetical protein [Intestinimonas massiliensis (ex Afouda et al. 2020)]